jgi:hypothetical protein
MIQLPWTMPGRAIFSSPERAKSQPLLDACEHYLSYERAFAQMTIAGCTTVTGQFLLATFANGRSNLTKLDVDLATGGSFSRKFH